MPTRYDALFDRYVKELRAARDLAVDWWKKLVAKEGEKEARRRWPNGPAAHPRVIDVLRRYWFEVEKLNEEVEAGRGKKDEDVIYPHLFLGEDLLDGKNDDLGAFLDKLTYWPLGLDEKENRV